jgi:L-aminopeptidase/D-esterase-like protein
MGTMKMNALVVGALVLLSSPAVFSANGICPLLRDPVNSRPFKPVATAVKGLSVASLQDPTNSTGATIFYFPKGARANFDARGGSVAAAETTLLSEGGYSNEIDAVVFTGGSTMGLEVGSGVRKAIFETRGEEAGAFDRIPSVPTAVVYDFDRAPHYDQQVYPNREMGVDLFNAIQAKGTDVFKTGRFGAGTSTTVNKVSEPIHGGQGAASARLGKHGSVFVAVILNAVGNVFPDGQSVTEIRKNKPPVPGKNTTLSIVVTDIPLDRNQLKRLATTVHTSMARWIQPFQTYTDGDIMFSVSTAERPGRASDDVEFYLTEAATELMGQAISDSIRVSNNLPARQE